ncbi:Uncharacterised protein [uncultured archaeon]|nr:Uncharacterised protein [uncultured archaeon]
MDIEEEVKFPTKDSEWIVKVLIGGILGIIPIINLIEYGYILKVMKGAIDGNPGMPKWDDWGNLFINGLIGFVISLIYLIIPILIIFVSAGGIMAAAFSGNMNLMAGMMAGAIGGILIGLLLALVFGFMVPMALAMYTKENSFGAAFRIGEVVSRIKSVFADYITVYIVLIVLLFILGLLNFIPILGFLIMIFGTFYVSVVAFNMFGKVCARSSA